MRAALPSHAGYLMLTYEEMLRTPQRALHRVFGHLGVPSCRVNETRSTHRIMSGNFKQHVHNWEELCAGLANATLRTEVWEASCIPTAGLL
mmetsp:Transcript_64311/g.171529  ORF Transcript_64311/g.171529 Transcript_64311/m.171529 type:complete len:91 (-) Transcript_64311:94-366(-)